MTGRELRDSLLRALHVENSAQVPATWHYDVASSVNAALQEIWKSPLGDSWSRMSWSFSTSAGTGSYTLNPTITNLLGDATADSYEMIEVKGEGNARQLEQRFGVSLEVGGRPRFYSLQRLNGGASAADASLLRMTLLPTPVRIHTIRFDALTEPPNFSACDLDSAETTVPMPDKHVENILLPIALWHLAGLSVKMLRADFIQRLDARYGRARAELGYSEPSAARRESKPQPAAS